MMMCMWAGVFSGITVPTVPESYFSVHTIACTARSCVLFSVPALVPAVHRPVRALSSQRELSGLRIIGYRLSAEKCG